MKDSSERILCRTCKKYFNPGNLDEVIFHETHKEAVDIQYKGSIKISGNDARNNTAGIANG